MKTILKEIKTKYVQYIWSRLHFTFTKKKYLSYTCYRSVTLGAKDKQLLPSGSTGVSGSLFYHSSCREDPDILKLAWISCEP